MFPETDKLYKGSNRPSNLLQSKLLQLRYATIPTNIITSVTSDPEEREIFSNAMEEDVRDEIARARTGTPVDAYQAALTMAQTFDGAFTFGSWFGYRESLLGGEQCNEIGQKIVAEKQFDKEEAQKIMAKHKKVYDKAMEQERKRMEQEQ